MTADRTRWTGTADYVASPSLRAAVDASLVLERPLLIRGEPGTGKTLLASSVSKALGHELISWNVKSTSKARDGLYVYDVVRRLNDSRFGTPEQVASIERYIDMGPLGRAFAAEELKVVLIDEIDKADVEFPNDLLQELDLMRFQVAETGEEIVARERPFVVITSNAEKELPDAFLRRCVFHFIEFPDRELMARIVRVHHPGLEAKVLDQVIEVFFGLRNQPRLRKRPSTSELIDWIAARRKAGVDLKKIGGGLPFLGTLLKTEQDVEMVTRGKA